MIESRNKIRIGITTGDQNGIGPEVVSKALAKFHSSEYEHVQFWIWSSRTDAFGNLDLVEKSRFDDDQKARVCVIKNSASPADWFSDCVQLTYDGIIDGIATAPMSKTLIKQSGRSSVGHTEIIKEMVDKNDPLFMGFVGQYFNVLLLTGHISLDKVSEALTEETVVAGIQAATKLRDQIGDKRPLALIGVDPHAGEQGLIGNIDLKLAMIVKEFQRQGIEIEGPLVADSAFDRSLWDRYSVYVCPYHDQGLIPFKMIHGHGNGVHITCGSKIIRTSVDHGTAYDIAGKNIANPNSMIEAVDWCLKLVEHKIASKGVKNDLGERNFSRVRHSRGIQQTI